MIENNKSLVPFSVILKGMPKFKSIKFDTYYYVLGSFVRGIDRVNLRYRRSLEKYSKVLKIEQELKNGLSLNRCIEKLKMAGIYILKLIDIYTKIPFYEVGEHPSIDLNTVIECLLNNYYCCTNEVEFPDTREFLKNELRKDILFRRSRGFLLKSDLVRNIEALDNRITYDFSKVPEYLSNTDEEIILNCLLRNPRNPEKLIGEFKTSYKHMVTLKSGNKILSFYFSYHTWEDYYRVIENYNKIKYGFFPIVPISFYRNPILVEFIYQRPNDSRRDHYYFLPETQKWYPSRFDLIQNLNKLGLSYVYWECLYILKLNPSLIGSDQWIKRKINIIYGDKPNYTKRYISDQLKKDVNFEFKGMMVREDFLNEYYQTYSKRKFKFSYNFSEVQEIIKSKSDKIILYCDEKDKFGNLIGYCETNYENFISKLSDPIVLRGLKLSKMNMFTKEEFLSSLNGKYDDFIDFSETEYKGFNVRIKVRCKICGNYYYYVRPGALVYEKFSPCCSNPGGRKLSTGEESIKFWLNQNNIPFADHYIIRGVKGRNTEKVFVDFYIIFRKKIYIIEYNGIQHYKEIEFFHRTHQDFVKQVNRDLNLKEYCKKENIIFVEIPYTYKGSSICDLLEDIFFKGKNSNYINIPKIIL